MKITDVINHVSLLLGDKTGKSIYIEQIGEMKADCIYIELISSNRKTTGINVEQLSVKLDVKYYDSVSFQSNIKIQEMLDTINNAFDRMGIKNIKILDRFITLDSINQTIADGVGHYIFTLNLLTDYGSRIEYDLMQKLETEVKTNV
ncbi:MAG: phage tail terminator family protein [Fusobacteriaceae bacterium]